MPKNSNSQEVRAQSVKKRGSLRLHRAGHDPRAAALTVLSRVLDGRADSQAALDEALHSSLLTPTDKRLCTELVYGVLRRYIALEDFANGFLSKPDKLPAEMRLALLQALYEMACLRIPHHASVGWTVTHIRNRFGQGLSRVANGALRSMQRSLDEFGNPRRVLRDADAAEDALARFFAVPAWIVALWLRHYGLEGTHALLEAAQGPAPSGLRLNRARSDWEQAKAALVALYQLAQIKESVHQRTTGTEISDGEARTQHNAFEPGETTGIEKNELGAVLLKPPATSKEKLFLAGACGLAFPGPLPWQTRDLLQEGKASRQSAASYEVLEAFEPASWRLPIWDCCAGRGGKTLALLEQGIAVCLASDPSEHRLNALSEEYARLKLTAPPCPEVLPLTAEESAARLAEQSRTFGTILIDVPCSGLGTLSRRPEIRFRRTPGDLDKLADTQKRILALAWERLEPGGSIIYLTCTLNPAENEGQVAAFLEQSENAELLREFRTDFSSPLREFFYGAQIRKRP